jgi:hypothetical protein
MAPIARKKKDPGGVDPTTMIKSKKREKRFRYCVFDSEHPGDETGRQKPAIAPVETTCFVCDDDIVDGCCVQVCVAAGAHISTDPSAATPSATAKKRASS